MRSHISGVQAMSQATCWVVTDGKAGNENQCVGLAERLGLVPVIKRIVLRPPWGQLVPFLRQGLGAAFSADGDAVSPPWPDLLIASGRPSVAASLYARRASAASGGRRTFTVQIQNPVISPDHFDLLAVPRHDGLLGDNVVTTRGSLHRVTAELLRAEADKFRHIISGIPGPLTAVVVGGKNSVYDFAPSDASRLAAMLSVAVKDSGGGLLVTMSRRSGKDCAAALREGLRGAPSFIWNGEGENPYYGMLGLADTIVVTSDSVNMASEACSTGKPVHVFHLEGGSEKFRRFHQTLRDDGMARPFRGRFENWSYQPLDDVRLVADRIRCIANI